MSYSSGIKNCKLLGFEGILVQGSVGLLSLMSLIVKRYFESPKRKMNIFLLDVFKQCLSSGFMHFINVFISISLREQKDIEDECSTYLISFLLDASLGVILTILLLKLHYTCFTVKNHLKCEQGNYIKSNGDFSKEAYIIQCVIWISISVIVKIILFFFLYEDLFYLIDMGNYILYPIHSSIIMKLVFVIVIVPFFSNVFIFFIFDYYLKKGRGDDYSDIRYFEERDNSTYEFDAEEIKNILE